jgi:hypothetical protein
MKIKTSELSGAALDWAVAKCEGWTGSPRSMVIFKHQNQTRQGYCYSLDWAQAGPIIEREKIEWQWLPRSNQYGARKPSLGGLNRTFCMDGPTILVAAMRCYVASQLGDEVDVPDELTTN